MTDQTWLRTMLAGVAGVSVAATLLVSIFAGPVAACSLLPEYRVPLDVLAEGEAAFAQHFAADWSNADAPTPEIVGAYHFEVVESVDPVVLDGRDEVSRGSVGVYTRYWGQAPDELGPVVVGWPVRWERVPDTGGCQHLTYPPDVPTGRSSYWLVAADGTTYSAIAAPGVPESASLDAVFGPATEVERDHEAEQALVAEMQAAHDELVAEHRSGQLRRWTVVAIGAVLVAAVVVLVVVAVGIVGRQRRAAAAASAALVTAGSDRRRSG